MTKRKSEVVRTNQQIVDLANRIAWQAYAMMGYGGCPKDYRFDQATHPQERLCWRIAVAAFDLIDGTDVENVLEELGDDAPVA